MKRIDILKKKLADLEAKRGQYLRSGRYAQMYALDKDIAQVKADIEVAKEFELKPLRELMSTKEIIESKMIHRAVKLHIAADYVAEVAYEMYDALAALGFELHTIAPEFIAVAKNAQSLANKLIDKAPALTELLTENETLLKAIDKKVETFIGQRVK